MSPRVATSAPTSFSEAIAAVIDREIGLSGSPVAHVIRAAGISRNYYYKRIRGESVFNTNDISNIAEAIGLDPFELTRLAIEEMRKREHIAPVTHAQFGEPNVGGAGDDEIVIPKNVEEEWLGKYAAHPKGDEPIDHGTP